MVVAQELDPVARHHAVVVASQIRAGGQSRYSALAVASTTAAKTAVKSTRIGSKPTATSV